MSRQRVNSIGKKKNDEYCIRYTQREEWVKYLISMGKQVPESLIKQIEEDKKKEIKEDLFNNFKSGQEQHRFT